jgi:hypothetical protein
MIRKFVFILLVSVAVGCRKAEDSKAETATPTPTKTITTKVETETPKATLPIEVAKLIEKSGDELDKIFGKPLEIKPDEEGAEYRLYKIEGEPKGFAVRFYGGKAKSFNMIFAKPISTSKAALQQVFKIDVGNSPLIKNPKEPLTEAYQGTFNGVKFTKVSAKKDGKGNEFIFVLAETK